MKYLLLVALIGSVAAQLEWRCPTNENPLFPTHLAHPQDCTKFLKCALGKAHELSCPTGQHWSAANGYCDVPERAKCDTKVILTPREAPVDETPQTSDDSEVMMWGGGFPGMGGGGWGGGGGMGCPCSGGGMGCPCSGGGNRCPCQGGGGMRCPCPCPCVEVRCPCPCPCQGNRCPCSGGGGGCSCSGGGGGGCPCNGGQQPECPCQNEEDNQTYNPYNPYYPQYPGNQYPEYDQNYPQYPGNQYPGNQYPEYDQNYPQYPNYELPYQPIDMYPQEEQMPVHIPDMVHPAELPCPQYDTPGVTVMFGHHTDCELFYTCYGGRAIQMRCPANFHWNDVTKHCDQPQNANCQARIHGY